MESVETFTDDEFEPTVQDYDLKICVRYFYRCCRKNKKGRFYLTQIEETFQSGFWVRYMIYRISQFGIPKLGLGSVPN